MSLFTGFLKKDSRSIVRQFTVLFKKAVKVLNDADDDIDAEIEGKLTLNGTYLTRGDGEAVSDAGIKLDTPDIVQTIGVDVAANTKVTKDLFTDNNRTYSIVLTLKVRRAAAEDEEA